MPLRNRFGFLGSGLKINGTIKSCQVATGESISAGSFVEYSNGFIKTFGSVISGVAKTSGSGGAMIDVWVPEGYDFPSGGSYPEGAFIPVTKFTAGKQYALVAKIDGTYRYINTTTYNNYTMNATQIGVTQGSGYVTFDSEPALFTAAASGSGFTLANGSNYLHGTTSSGTALRVGTTSAVWTVDSSATGGFSSGKYLAKEDNSAVWLKCNDGTYDWSIKYETAGSFGYDRDGRDTTYSTGFVSIILYEKAEGGSSGSGGSDSGSSGGGTTASYTVTLTGGMWLSDDGDTTNDMCVVINNTKYASDTTITINSGTRVSVRIGQSIAAYNDIAITYNGSNVQTGAGTYTFTPTGNVTIKSAMVNGVITFAITTN